VVSRKKGLPFSYDYNIIKASNSFKKVLYILKALRKKFLIFLLSVFKSKRLKAYSKKKKLIILRPLLRAYGRIRRSLRRAAKSLVLSVFYGQRLVSFRSELSGVLRTNAHFYNLFSDITAFVNKFPKARRIAVGPVARPAYVLKKYPLLFSIKPFSLNSDLRASPN
jgi:hypothetical protein